ncbi:MAG: hypothetical protein A2231_06755 [Candidatus Firestonebacteria bacterium RIFOXYA2_FULL_40_8]|nr:MAG: hypothetical protein A2231_06755 [Candidatus Firestonebacteria bacterium RIFOXYA2_FULL_40_8]
MTNKKQKSLNPELEFKKIKAEIDKVAKVQKLLAMVIRFSVTVLMVLLMFVFFMALNYAMPISSKVSQFILYGLLAYFVISLLSYVIKPLFDKVNEEELALMIEKRYPALLDRFICSVEMNKTEAVANFSPELIKALWVDTDKVRNALKLDMRKALAFTKGKQYIVIALVLTVVAFVGSIVAPEFLLKGTSGIKPVNSFVSKFLRGDTLDPDMLRQSKAIDQQLKDKDKMIEDLKNVLASQKKFNNDLKDTIQDRKAEEQKRAAELAQKDPELAKKPWLPGRDPQFKNPNVGGVSGIVTSNGKPMAGIYVAVKSVTDKKAAGVGVRTDKDGKWVVNNLSTDGSYQAWVLNSRYKSEPLSYFSGVVVEKGRVRTGYDFALKAKTLAVTDPNAAPAAPHTQAPQNPFSDSDTYEEPRAGQSAPAGDDPLFPKMDFEQQNQEQVNAQAERNRILIQQENAAQQEQQAQQQQDPQQQQQQQDQKSQCKEQKLDQMAKELEQQNQQQNEQNQQQKECSEKMKELSAKMEDMKKNDNKQDDKQKDKECKEIQKQLEETAKQLENINKEEKNQERKECNKEMAKEIQKMAEEMKQEEQLKAAQENLEKQTEDLAKKDQIEKEKDAKDCAEKAKEKQDETQKQLQKSEMEKALEQALEAEKKLEECLSKLMEEKQKMTDQQSKDREEQAKKEDDKKNEEKCNEDQKKVEDLEQALKDQAKSDEAKLDEKKLEEMMKELEDAAKKMENCDKAKADEIKKEIEQVKKDLAEEAKDTEKKDEKKCSQRKQEIAKKLESLAGLLGELKNKAFLAQKHGTDEDPVANMTKDEVPSKYVKLVGKYRTALSK